ncbi:condensation domain-containing protein [Pantoea cypripedii]|uniref:Phthiocerol/phthiodiolone dimycocerosyl transferase n=1 Tax=Pantoea cypripedii TaxID=55209 RepID=A0A6B9GAR3_PANCY|nr:condensation domain-containing protein [Pantoea cypripedii]QGY32440.1 chromosome condensation protein [Pantoea cypripedii]
MENTSQNETTLRPLGALESYAWHIDTTSPKHFTVSAEINGVTRLDDWSSALKKVQSRHPLINARVDADSDNRLYFFHDQTIEIPLRIARLNKISSIEEEIKREFSAPFGTGDMALLKAALLYSEERCVIIFTAHHTIADGRSLAHFIHDLLETLAGKNLPELALLPSLEDLCSVNEESVGNIKVPHFTEEPVPYTERSLAKLQILRQRLSPELSVRIRQRAKQENTTVHGALSAAFALALYQSSSWCDRPVRICTPIDARKYSASDYGLSFLALFPTYSYEASNTDDFWNIARAVTEDLNLYREKHGMVELINLVGPTMKNNGLNGMIQFDREICAPDILISNLGVLPFSQNFGELTLESLWGPNVLIGTQDEQTIGVATINGAIHLIHTSYNSTPDFLEEAKNILTSATDIMHLN